MVAGWLYFALLGSTLWLFGPAVQAVVNREMGSDVVTRGLGTVGIPMLWAIMMHVPQ